MVHGYFPSSTNVPCIEVAILSREKVSLLAFILDTGFSGGLKIDEQTAKTLGIIPTKESYGINASGERIPAKVACAYVELEGRKMLADIFITNGVQLAGIGLFSLFGYKIVVDCRNKTAHLE